MNPPSDPSSASFSNPPPAQQPTPPKSYTYYHAGPLFTLSDLSTNASLSHQITTLSQGQYVAVLPQNLEPRSLSPHDIRDADIRALLSCDLALFVYDGVELDSGTVVEYMLAKMADLPCVILRTDFRGAGDQGGAVGEIVEESKVGERREERDRWNLMASFWPRTERVRVDGMAVYRECLAEVVANGSVTEGEVSIEAGKLMVGRVAALVVEAFERVRKLESVLPKELREGVYRWLAIMPGFRDGMVEGNVEGLLRLLNEKEGRGLL